MVTDSASLPDLLKSFKSKSISVLEISDKCSSRDFFFFFF